MAYIAIHHTTTPDARTIMQLREELDRLYPRNKAEGQIDGLFVRDNLVFVHYSNGAERSLSSLARQDHFISYLWNKKDIDGLLNYLNDGHNQKNSTAR